MKVIEIENGMYAVTVDKKPSLIYRPSKGTKEHAENFLKVQKAMLHILAAQTLLKSIGCSMDSMSIGHAALDIVESFDDWHGSYDWRA
jgi:hypothetical protein